MKMLCYDISILFLFIMATSGGHSCPKMCFCPRVEEAICEFGPETSEIPQTMTSSLRNLTVNGGKLSEISDKDFDPYPDLEKIQLTRNNIFRIAPFAFRNLSRLRFLIIQNNPLESLDPYSFGDIKRLNELILTHNQIRDVKKNAFYETSAKYFDLRHNPVDHIESFAFANVKHVDHLHLPLYLRDIQPDAFNNMSDVHFIHIRYWKAQDSQVRGVASHTFRGLVDVKSILIDDSHLGILHAHSLAGTEKVDHFSIRNSEINKIKRHVFSGDVKNLELSSNLIWTIEPKVIFDLFRKSKSNVKLDSNNFDCTCYNLGLFDEMTNVSLSLMNNNFCVVPKEFNKKRLIEISKEYIEECHRFRLVNNRNRTDEYDSNSPSSQAQSNIRANNYSYRLINVVVLVLCVNFLVFC